jgi:hypothetical protein
MCLSTLTVPSAVSRLNVALTEMICLMRQVADKSIGRQHFILDCKYYVIQGYIFVHST